MPTASSSLPLPPVTLQSDYCIAARMILLKNTNPIVLFFFARNLQMVFHHTCDEIQSSYGSLSCPWDLTFLRVFALAIFSAWSTLGRHSDFCTNAALLVKPFLTTYLESIFLLIPLTCFIFFLFIYVVSVLFH